MSYILDALKKSDQERQRHTAPGINTAHTDLGRERKGRALWPYLLIAALCLNAALLLWWLQPWQSTKRAAQTEQRAGQGTAATEAAAVTAAKEHDAVRMAELEPPHPAAPQQAELTAANDPARRESKESKEGPEPAPDTSRVKPDTKKVSDPPAAKARSADPDETAHPAAVSRSARKSVKDGPTSSSVSRSATAQPVAGLPRRHQESSPANAMGREDEKVSSMPAAVKQGLPTDRKDAAPMDVQPPSRPSARVEEDLEPLMDSVGENSSGEPELDGLPLDIRRDLPGLSISMLVYARNPADRMVGVNGRVLREGQQVEPDLKLLQITPKGAVFSFRGHRFYKPVL